MFHAVGSSFFFEPSQNLLSFDHLKFFLAGIFMISWIIKSFFLRKIFNERCNCPIFIIGGLDLDPSFRKSGSVKKFVESSALVISNYEWSSGLNAL